MSQVAIKRIKNLAIKAVVTIGLFVFIGNAHAQLAFRPAGNSFDQDLNTTDSPTFDELTLTGTSLTVGGTFVCLEDGTNCPVTSAEEINDLEDITTGIQTTEIPIGTGPNTVAYAALSGDATMNNAGVVTIAANAVGLGTDTTGNYALGDAEGGAATTGDSATAFFSSGTIEHERGGLEADVSAYDGLIGITGGATYNQTGTTTQIIIFDGSGAPTSAALSGDVTMTNGGVVTIGANSVALTTDTTGNYAAGDAEAGNALTGDSATAFFSAGQIERARGGTGADTSAYGTGLLGSDSGNSTIDVDTSAEVASSISDETGSGALVFGTSPTITAATIAGTTTLSGTIDASSTGNIVILTATTLPSNCRNGEIGYDSDGTSGQRFYICESGTWVKQGDGSGGGAANTSVNLPIYSAKITGGYVVFTPPTADACTQGAQIDAGDGNWRLLFDATTDECATWQFVIPNNYSSTPVLDIYYSMASATSGTVEFEAAVMCTTSGDSADINTASFSNVAVATETVPGTAGYIKKLSITLTDDSCAAGDIAFIVISTDSNDGTNDTATGDREVIGVRFGYTGA